MESLALLAALIVISVWGLAAISVLTSLLGLRKTGAFLGVLSVVAGVWLLFILPHAPFLGLVNIFAGFIAIRRRKK